MDVFSTEYLAGVVENLIRPPSFILDRYYPTVQTFESEEIHFDIIDKKRRLAPLVSPYVPGKVMNKVGRKVNTFSPAYTKDKRVFEPSLGFKRAIGEQIGGMQLDPARRIEQAVVVELEDQVDVLTRRLELMAVESLRTGKCVIAGEQYPSVTVDFQRDATLTIAALAGGARWNQVATATPLDNLRTWALKALKLSTVYPTDIYMHVTDYQFFIQCVQVKDRWTALNSNQLGTNIALGKELTEGGVYMGSIDGFNIFVYSGWYTAEADAAPDAQNEILAPGQLFGCAPQVKGVRAFGAIKDMDALKAAEYFPKSWTNDDPSVRYIMLQSAPLMIPTRPNASFGATLY